MNTAMAAWGDTLTRVAHELGRQPALDRPADLLARRIGGALGQQSGQGCAVGHLARASPPSPAHRSADRLLDLGVHPRPAGRPAVTAGRDASGRVGRAHRDPDRGERRERLVGHVGRRPSRRARPRRRQHHRGGLATRRRGCNDAVVDTGGVSRSAWPVRRPRPSVGSSAVTSCRPWASASTALPSERPRRPGPAVASASDVGEEPRCYLAGDAPVVVLRHRGSIVALDAHCPHRGAPMDEGTVDGDVFTCPWHGSQFDLPDGLPAPRPGGHRAARARVSRRRRHRRGPVRTLSPGAGVVRLRGPGGTARSCGREPRPA